MRYIFIDTETNGKIKDFKLPLSRNTLDNFPRVTQIAWQFFNDEDDFENCAFSSLIIPDGWVIPKEKFFIDNGMSTERCEQEGLDIEYALLFLIDDIEISDIIVAHNMDFDYRVIGAEMIRAGLSSKKKLKRICTMQSSINFCKLPGKYGFKYPKLEELHKILFKEDIEDAHDALGDVKTCMKCFFKLKELGIIKI